MSARRKAFTLVELLVVIAIIGILVSLLMPAVQAAREAGRRAQCLNNIRQMAVACLNHEQAQQFFPTGGWGWGWVGDPDRGYSHKQPGGWLFNILPFMEQGALHNQGLNANEQGRIATLKTPVQAFVCPSSRPLKTYPYTHGGTFVNTPNFNATSPIARTDYAANGGDSGWGLITYGPGSLASADSQTPDQWNAMRRAGTPSEPTGVIYIVSEISVSHIKDGTSHTYLIGERYQNPDGFETGQACSDDQAWNMGYDFDVNRWTDPGSPPLQHTPGIGGCDINFGSAHSGTFNMAFCDGSARAVSYSIDLETHRRLGHRNDGLVIDDSKY